MALIEWSQRLSVDVKQCDEQHKLLVGLINELHDGMKAGRGNDVLGKTFLSLIDYTKTHFRDEEKLLQQHGYPALADQKKSHEAFVAELNKLFEQFKGGGVLTISVMNFLKKWLESHIQGDDRKYGPFMNSKGVL